LLWNTYLSYMSALSEQNQTTMEDWFYAMLMCVTVCNCCNRYHD
jgi:hypothetical protein